MRGIFKRLDLAIVLLLYFLFIPIEYHEVFSLLEDQTISFRHAMRSVIRDKNWMSFSYDRMTIVNIDEMFYEEYGKFPLKRKDLAAIIRNINDLGARVICVDLFMNLPSAYNDDAELANALNESDVILASHGLFDADGKFQGMNYPSATFNYAGRSGYVNLISPSTAHTFISRLRIYPEIFEFKDGWPISIQVLSRYLGEEPVYESGRLKIGDLVIPLDQFNDVYIDFSSLPDGYQFLHEVVGISAIEFLDIADLEAEEIVELKEWVNGKIVFIGETQASSNDWFDTPVGTIYGVEIIADTVNTLLKNLPLRPAPLWGEIIVSLLFLGSLVLVINLTRSPGMQALSAATLFAGYILLATAAYVYLGSVLSMTYDLVAGFSVFSILSLSSFIRERRIHIAKRNQAEVELRKAHDELEIRVEQRTAELSETNTRLRSEIHERKTAEKALVKAKEVAEIANKAKSTFLANMSHELRTPLNAILGFSELMTRDPNITKEQQRNLETIGRSGEHLLALISDVLEFSKIEAGRVVLTPVNFDLHRMLLGIEEMFRMRCESKGLQLICEQSNNVPQYVCGDQNKIRQILINLLGNAVKFTGEGCISLRVRRALPGKNMLIPAICALQIEVEDSGVGIGADELNYVFDAFVQTSSGQQSQQGTGLGMTISRKFVNMMGGEMRVKSDKGRGALFQFEINIEIIDPEEVRICDSGRQVIGLEPGQPKYRLLVVDDVAVNRNLMIKLLMPMGFEIREASNGKEAIDIWQEWKPHLMWMDIRMEVMDGLEVTRRIRELPGGRDTAIVALTASAFEEDRKMVIEGGCDDFLSKPCRQSEIFDMLAKHLDLRFLYEQGQEDTNRVPLTAVMLAGLPAGMREELWEAIEYTDFDAALECVEQIRSHNKQTADSLEELLNDYKFDTIQMLFPKA